MAEGKGVQLEWAIVYWALKNAGNPQILQQRIQEFPVLEIYGNGVMKSAAIAAVATATKAGAPLALAFHSDEKGIRGNPEPKTDILLGAHRVSVKMEGAIQLSSGEGRSTAAMFRNVMVNLLEDPSFEEDLAQDILEGIVERIENTPTKMIDPKNLAKAMIRKRNQAMKMLGNGQLLDNYNWKVWEANNKKQITDEIISYLDNNYEFKYRLIEEALTGKSAFGPDDLATADYILTPSYYGPIDATYIKKTMEVVKIQVRAKSRSGITSAAFRFDVASASKTAAVKLEPAPPPVAEGRWEDLLSGTKENIHTTVMHWLQNFKNTVIEFFARNIKRVIKAVTNQLTVSITPEE